MGTPHRLQQSHQIRKSISTFYILQKDMNLFCVLLQAKPLLESNKVKELVDPRLEDNYDPTEMKRAMLTASMCISH